MALDSKATPEERFKAWLAEQEADRVPLPRNLPARPRFWSSTVPLLVCLLFWVVVLWRLGSGLMKTLWAI